MKTDEDNETDVCEPLAEYNVSHHHTEYQGGLNPAQLHFLRSLNFLKTEEDLKELKQIIRNYYLSKLEQDIDKYWGEGKITDDIVNEHLRTPYK
ncbi:MAG: hypothetical protein LBC49_02940 [Bacteroidales bacterium]|jgi:hypothetical protein|nr:hypothetical protein [Bacteroidales bacterium]